MKKIAFIGVGGYFGGKMTRLLEEKKDIQIYFIARGAHLEQIQCKGLLLKMKDEGERICKPTLATHEICELPMLDACFIAVKAYDLENVLLALKSRIKENTEIIPLLNGVDIPNRIRQVIQKGRVYPACVYVGTHIERPGVVTQNGGSCTILFGKDPLYPESKPEELMNLMSEADIRYEWHENCQIEIWKKYLFIASCGLVTTAYNQTLGQLDENDELKKLTIEVIKEMVALARMEGVLLEENVIKETIEKLKTFPYETKTSFHRDYEKGGKDERELFGGAMLQLAQKYHVRMPHIEAVYRLL